jgi:UDP-GlcNAc3NAcA epimerase
MNVLYIVGNRPQFIKLAVLHEEMKKHKGVNERIVHTGQHFSAEMNAVFFDELSIDLPIVNLRIKGQSHVAMIGRILEALEKEILKNEPDCIVVFGDTNSTLAGAIAGKKLNIPVVHIEAGIRTCEEDMPEESNRYLTDRVSLFNFCCTQLGLQNLVREGYGVSSAIPSYSLLSGDLMLDAYHYYFKRFVSRPLLSETLNISRGAYVVSTIHRRQNIEDATSLINIISALNEIDKEYQVICPLHPNTKSKIENCPVKPQFTIVSPLGYLDMQSLLHNCSYVITDSGGVQREAFFANKPVLILMNKPFWPEILENGNALNCAAGKKEIISAFDQLKKQQKENNISVFGNGNAAQIITAELINYFQNI